VDGSNGLAGGRLFADAGIIYICFARQKNLQFTIGTWIAYWKREFVLKHKRLAGRSPHRNGSSSRRGWHHRLRDGENYSGKWIYVQENPFRKGLVQRVEDWPFRGRIFDLVWSGK